MSPYKAPDHIWHVILPYLDTPRPAPLSRPPRSALRKPDLCALALTCRLFHSITVPLLYTEIVCDSLPLLVSTVDPTNPLSYHRFAHTRKLFLETAPIGQDLPYNHLLKDDRDLFWMTIGRTVEEAEITMLLDLMVEAEGLVLRLKDMKSWDMAKLFPKLLHISVSSIYGKQDQRWEEFREEWDKRGSWPLHECAGNFARFLSSGNLRHICMRNANGPFGIHTYKPLPKPPSYTICLHINSPSDTLNALPGSRTRWISEYPPETDLSQIVLDVGRGLTVVEGYRQAPDIRPFASRAINLAIIGSTKNFPPPGVAMEDLTPKQRKASVLSEEMQRKITKEWGEQQQEGIRASGLPTDVVKWLPTSCIMPCEACGSGIRGDKEGQWKTGPYAVSK